MVDANDKIIIEDSVDSLIVDEKDLFPNAGEFEFISLPKIFGCPFGAIVFCKSETLQNSLKAIQEASIKFGVLHHSLRLMSGYSQYLYQIWHNLEPLSGVLPGYLHGSVAYSLENWDNIASELSTKVNLLEDHSLFSKSDSSRLPCCIPIEVSERNKHKLVELGLYVGLRRYFSLGAKHAYIETLPVPIHKDVSISKIEELSKFLASKD